VTVKDAQDIAGIRLDYGWCCYCDADHGWSEAIQQQLQREFPVESQLSSWPANSTYILRSEALHKRHEQLTWDFTYDDKPLQICPKHLRALANIVEVEQSA